VRLKAIIKARFDLIKLLLHLTIQNKSLTITDLAMEEAAGLREVINGHDEKGGKEDIFTKVVRAGKRTYFFDVKATRNDDYYLTITESKKRIGKEGKIFYEKHKIFLYKEDFEKFTDGLINTVEYIDKERASMAVSEIFTKEDIREENGALSTVGFTDLDFDDLGKK
jgi:hypothetical protein